MKYLYSIFGFAFLFTYAYGESDVYIDETDYYDLVDDLTPLDSFEVKSSNDDCKSENELKDIIQTKAIDAKANVIYYSEYKAESKFDKCTHAKVYLFNADSGSKIHNHNKLVEIANRQKYALKISTGYTTGSYYAIIGGEYIFPFVYPVTMFYIPSIYVINKKIDELYVQLSGPTLLGIIDSYYIKNIIGNRKDNRFGLKVDGGFFVTENLAHIFPYDWFKYGSGLNYHLTLQPYISYTYASENYNREIMAGIVLTKWLNPNGLIICCK